jgi:hypothetical protein
MRTNKDLIMISLFLTLCIVPLAGIARADATVGVKSGDWAKYNVTYPSDAQSYVVSITVNKVSGTKVSLTLDYYVYGNSTPFGSDSRQVDISSDCWIDGYFPAIVPTGLSAGNPIPGAGSDQVFWINDTTQHLGRDAAHATVTSADGTADFYWDRQTGMLLEEIGTPSSVFVSYKVDSTNMWNTSLDWLVWVAIILVVVVAVGVFAVALVRHRRRPPTHASSSQVQHPPPPPPPPPP